MKLYVSIILTLITSFGFAQISYTGRIDKTPIQLVIHMYISGEVLAVCAYDADDSAIKLNGRKKSDTLELFETDDQGRVQARWLFKQFNSNENSVFGEWISADYSVKRTIELHKQFDIEDNSTWRNRELIQASSTQQHYFKLLISKDEVGADPRVTGVKIIEKATDKLIQTIALDCQLQSLVNITTGDYNFDGFEDFSVFEESYAGPNTSRVYILKDTQTNQYFVSNFSGVSLTFDYGARKIYERNQCCAGKSIQLATYQVVNNEMVLIGKECMEYDVEKQNYVTHTCH